MAFTTSTSDILERTTMPAQYAYRMDYSRNTSEIFNADFVDEAEANKLSHPVELLISIAGTASLSNHKLSLKD